MSSRVAVLAGLVLAFATLGGATMAETSTTPRASVGPSAPTASPVAGGQRFGVPEAGFALTFPDGWAVVRVTPGSNASLWGG